MNRRQPGSAPVMLSLSVLSALLACLVGSSVSLAAEKQYRIPAKQEDRVLALIKPKVLDDPIVGEWIIETADIKKDSIDFGITKGDAEATFSVRPPGAPNPAFETKSFSVAIAFDGVPHARQMEIARAFQALLTSNDPGGWWDRYLFVPTATPEPISTRTIPPDDGPDILNQRADGAGDGNRQNAGPDGSAETDLPLWVLAIPIGISFLLIVIFLPRILRSVEEEEEAEEAAQSSREAEEDVAGAASDEEKPRPDAALSEDSGTDGADDSNDDD